ncbi:putative DNA-binding pseudobarrel domain superfamily [Helianthus annuus]|nr:putative DNA-binding pseudobarrel domain superfamily [Helianthus annuus]
MNRADELLMGILSDAAAKMWGVDKGHTNVLIETDDGRTFVVFISAASGKFFLFNGWSDVVTHLRLQTGALVILNPLDSTRFKLTYYLNGVSPACFWTSLISTSSYLTVIPECILPKSHDYDLISTIHLSNKTFHVKIETVGGKACFTNGIDVIVSLYQLEADDQPAVAEQEAGRYIRFVCTAAKYFKGYGYALRRWSRFMNTAGIEVGDTVYFCFDELEQVLIVERVVPHVRRT